STGEVVLDCWRDARLELREIHGVAEDRGRGGDAKLGDAAWVDQLEVAQVGLQVDGEAVQRDAVALGDADRGDLSMLGEDANVAIFEVRGDAEAAQGVNDRVFQRANVARDR